jgi:hypothetical protein
MEFFSMQRNPAAMMIAVAMSIFSFADARSASSRDAWTLASPDGQLSVTLMLADLGGEADYPSDRTRLYYRIEHGQGARACEVLRASPLGILREDQDFVDGLKFVAADRIESLDETYTMWHGKRRVCRSLANQQAYTFENPAGARLQVVVRIAKDGVAFRYVFPETSEAVRTVRSEATGFRIPEGAAAWIEPYQEPSKWTPAYEDYYQNGGPAGTSAPNAAGWAFPALFHLPQQDRWLLLTEAAVDENYCGCRLQQSATHNVYRIRFPQEAEGNGVGQVCPRSSLPWKTPWRVIQVADSLSGIVESTLVTDLNPACAVSDTSWIRPGRVSWSWWSDHDSPRDYVKLRDFVDLAAEMGWEYSLVDANWTLMDQGNVRELARYAAGKGVGLFLWYNSGGPHNIVTEKPRGCLREPEVRRFEFDLLNQWGVKGVKVDFFHSDKQDMMQLYLGILRDAAEHRLMVNFHGCTVPRGWSRTYPNLMSMEAVRGAECYTFAEEYPEKAPWHNTILPFTRNVVGPMDYTPVAFSSAQYPRRTTAGHELALAVVFESGLLHFADRTAAYRNLPPTVRQFLHWLPVAWDDTRLLGGYPGQWVVLARRNGDQWYVGGINGQDEGQDVAFRLDFLGPGDRAMDLFEDGESGLAYVEAAVKGSDTTSVRMPPRGGFVARIRGSR